MAGIDGTRPAGPAINPFPRPVNDPLNYKSLDQFKNLVGRGGTLVLQPGQTARIKLPNMVAQSEQKPVLEQLNSTPFSAEIKGDYLIIRAKSDATPRSRPDLVKLKSYGPISTDPVETVFPFRIQIAQAQTR